MRKLGIIFSILIILQQAISKVKTPTETIYATILIIIITIFIEKEENNITLVKNLEKTKDFCINNMDFYREQWLEEKEKNKENETGK